MSAPPRPPASDGCRTSRRSWRPPDSGGRTPDSRRGSCALVVTLRRGSRGEDLRQPIDVDVATPARALEARGALRAQDVDPALQQPPPVRDLILLLRESLDQGLQLVVRERAEIGQRLD